MATQNMNETEKRERFVRVAEQRTQKILDDLKMLSKCANINTYEYNSKDLEKIFSAIEIEIQMTRNAFNGQSKFSLSDPLPKK